jgi:hypothetical protein
MPSKLAKKLDQLYLSRAELRKNKQVNKLQRIVKDCNLHILGECDKQFGALFVRRLKRSAKRSGRSVVGYSADVLVA